MCIPVLGLPQKIYCPPYFYLYRAFCDTYLHIFFIVKKLEEQSLQQLIVFLSLFTSRKSAKINVAVTMQFLIVFPLWQGWIIEIQV